MPWRWPCPAGAARCMVNSGIGLAGASLSMRGSVARMRRRCRLISAWGDGASFSGASAGGGSSCAPALGRRGRHGWRGRLPRGGRFTAGGRQHHRLARRGERRWTGHGLLPAAHRRFAALVLVFAVAGRAPDLADVVADKRHNGMVAQPPLARTVVIDEITNPKLARMHAQSLENVDPRALFGWPRSPRACAGCLRLRSGQGSLRAPSGAGSTPLGAGVGGMKLAITGILTRDPGRG